MFSGEAKIMEPDKCLGWKWITVEELPDNLFLPLNSFVKENSNLNQKLFYSS